jgi:hypothetical protein
LCFNPKKVLKGSERRPFISIMNAAHITMTSVAKLDTRSAHIASLIAAALAGK